MEFAQDEICPKWNLPKMEFAQNYICPKLYLPKWKLPKNDNIGPTLIFIYTDLD